MIIILSKPRVLLGFHPNPKFMEIKVGKSHKEQDEYGNSKVLYGFLYGICKDPWFYIKYVWSYMICTLV